MKTAALPGCVAALSTGSNHDSPAGGQDGSCLSNRVDFPRLGSTCLPQHLCRRSDPVLLAAVKCLLRTVPNLDACADLCFTIGHHQSFNHFLYPHSVHQTRIHSEFTLSPTTLKDRTKVPRETMETGLGGTSLLRQRKHV